MQNPRFFRVVAITCLSTSSFVVAGCASSKMTSSPQTTSATAAPTKEYEWHDMSTGKRFFGRPLPTTASAQSTSTSTPTP